jgi:Holliday junction resolvasome RuvABC endonuclease subunit
MKVLAIDQSYTSSGIVVLREGEMLHCEKFVTDKSKDIFRRAWDVVERVVKMTKDFEPDIIAMEGLAFNSKGNATRDLAGLQFSITTHMRYVKGADVRIVAPGTVKKVATGKGNSKKELLVECLPENIRAAFDDLGVKKTTGLGDLSDAYWIARTIEEIENE